MDTSQVGGKDNVDWHFRGPSAWKPRVRNGFRTSLSLTMSAAQTTHHRGECKRTSLPCKEVSLNQRFGGTNGRQSRPNHQLFVPPMQAVLLLDECRTDTLSLRITANLIVCAQIGERREMQKGRGSKDNLSRVPWELDVVCRDANRPRPETNCRSRKSLRH